MLTQPYRLKPSALIDVGGVPKQVGPALEVLVVQEVAHVVHLSLHQECLRAIDQAIFGKCLMPLDLS